MNKKVILAISGALLFTLIGCSSQKQTVLAKQTQLKTQASTKSNYLKLICNLPNHFSE